VRLARKSIRNQGVLSKNEVDPASHGFWASSR
jgi:hypothetical protein